MVNLVENKIFLTCDNLMVNRIINRQKNRKKLPNDYRDVMIINDKNEVTTFRDYHEALYEDGILFFHVIDLNLIF